MRNETVNQKLLEAAKEALEAGNDGDWQSARKALSAAITAAEAAQQPASAQPVAVPDGSLRARVADLIHLLQFFGMDAVSDADKSQAIFAMDDIRAMLSAASNP